MKKLAMGDIDHVKKAENDGEPERNEGDDQPPHQTVHCKRNCKFVHDEMATLGSFAFEQSC